MVEGTLAASLNKGRSIIAVLLGGHWIEGEVSSAPFLYASDYWVEPRTLRGPYFIASDGTRCGLCVGMRVRVL